MPIRFQCSQCGAGFKAGDAQGGLELPCPKCGANIQVPPPGAPMPEARLAPLDDPLDETQSSGFGDTQVNPFVRPAQPAAEPDAGEGPPDLSAPPPPPPPAATRSNAFESPRAPIERPRDVTLGGDVRVVDIKVPFWSIARLLFQIWLILLVLSFAAWALMAAVLAVVALVFGGGAFRIDVGP